MTPTHLVIEFCAEGVAGRARLEWASEPVICQALVDATPFVVRSHHAIYSGSEVAAVCPDLGQLPSSTATTEVAVGDVAYAYLLARDHYGVENDFAEICWFYDRDARPSMFSGPFPVSVFARLERAEAFLAASKRMRIEGAKEIRVSTQ